jgi:hypothetical protein
MRGKRQQLAQMFEELKSKLETKNKWWWLLLAFLFFCVVSGGF